MSTQPGTQPIPQTFKQRMLLWLWNLINAVIGGVAGAGAGIGVGAAVGATQFTTKQFWAMALGAGVVALFNYLRSNRLPDLFQGSSSPAP